MAMSVATDPLGFLALERLLERFPSLQAKPPTSARTTLLLGIGPWILLLLAIPAAAASPTVLDDAAFFPIPSRAVDRLLACGEPAPVWNDYNFGGYLLWRGDARYTVGIDGRAETLYSDQVVDSYIRTFLRQEGWDVAVQRTPAQYALMPRTAWAYSALPAGLIGDAPAPIDALSGLSLIHI